MLECWKMNGERNPLQCPVDRGVVTILSPSFLIRDLSSSAFSHEELQQQVCKREDHG